MAEEKSLSGLTEEEAKEFHKIYRASFAVFVELRSWPTSWRGRGVRAAGGQWLGARRCLTASATSLSFLA